MSDKPLRIGIAGLGTVGSAVLQLLRDRSENLALYAGRSIAVTAVSARNRARRDSDISGMLWVDDARQIAENPDVDVVVELIGGADGVAYDLCSTALSNGKHVVTANKAMLAKHGFALANLAARSGRALMFEAAVAGGIPVIKTARESLVGNNLTLVRGILNGTCNYILTRMDSQGLSFEVALKQAQDLGYAEADPTMDVDGHDTAHKLALLAAIAFGVPPQTDRVPTEGIRNLDVIDFHFARELGCRIKLLGVAQVIDGHLQQHVAPTLVPLDEPLSKVDNAVNAVQFEGDAVGSLTLQGRGAGGLPTASSVVSDIVDLARGGNFPQPFGVPVAQLRQLPALLPAASLSSWYIRLMVDDRPGVVAAISAILRDANISIESLLQHGRADKGNVPLMLTTHETSAEALASAAEKIKSLDCVRATPCCLRRG